MKVRIVESGEALANADLISAERRMGRSIPEEYRAFLLIHNGGSPEPSCFQMYVSEGEPSEIGCVDWFLGLHEDGIDDLVVYLDRFRERIPPRFFPIAHDAGGNLIVISTSGSDFGAVYFWDHEFEAAEGEPLTMDNIYFIAKGFDDFLENLTS